MKKIELSVVIPAYNEVVNIKSGVLGKVYDYLEKQNIPYEVIVVDDGSIDQTVENIESQIKNKPAFRIIKNRHGGKAMAVITGVLDAKGDIVLFTDMDQATPINQIDKLLPKFKEGYDIVIGSRHGRTGAPLLRKLSAWGFTALRDFILGLPFSDTQCGFKAFNRAAVNMIFPTLYKRRSLMTVQGAAVNAGFDIELLYLAKENNLKIADTFVEWHYVGSERVPFIKSSWEAFLDMIRIKINSMKGEYDLLHKA